MSSTTSVSKMSKNVSMLNAEPRQKPHQIELQSVKKRPKAHVYLTHNDLCFKGLSEMILFPSRALNLPPILQIYY